MTKLLFFLSALLPLISAHMIMIDPPALGYQNNPKTPEAQKDYNLASPLATLSDFPCKGKLNQLGTPGGASVASWPAGSQQKFTLHPGAPHNGGSCQASISEDKGKTWKVIKSYIGNCPHPDPSADTTETFTVPSSTKSGDVVFAWTWFNNEGNREMYMNCAVVTITQGGSGLPASLPDVFVANIGNGCTTVGSTNLEFPNPGADVLRSAGKGTPPVGTCQAATGGSGSAPAASGAPVASGSPSESGAPAASAYPTASQVLVAPVVSASQAATTVAAVNNGLYTGSPGNNGLYTPVVPAASSALASAPSPVASSALASAPSPIASSVVPSAIVPGAPSSSYATGAYGATSAAAVEVPVASSASYGAAPVATAAPCKRSVRYTRRTPVEVPGQPGCMCQCSGGGVPQVYGTCGGVSL